MTTNIYKMYSINEKSSYLEVTLNKSFFVENSGCKKESRKCVATEVVRNFACV